MGGAQKVGVRGVLPQNIKIRQPGTATGAIAGNKGTASLPATGRLGPSNITARFVVDLGGLFFAPIELSRLASMKLAADSVFGEMGLEVVDIAQRTFVPQTRSPGDISDLDGELAPRLLAGNAVGAITVTLAGAETGSAHDYKQVKQRTDGIGADAASRAENVIGTYLSQIGRYGVMVATEGTHSHPKPDEPAIGNPTIPLGKTWPALRILKRRGRSITMQNGIPVVDGLSPVAKGKDVIECTELASTTPEAFQQIAGKPKDNGACTVTFEADQWPVTADTYADKVAISPELVAAINARGKTLSVDVGGDTVETIRAISEASGIPLDELGVVCLGAKPRYKSIVDGVAVPESLKLSREGRKAPLLDPIERLGVNLRTIDDGESPALRTLLAGNEITFDNGNKGKAHIFIGPGGVFESMSLVRAIRDAGGDGWWCYVDKTATKKAELYANRTQLSPQQLEELAELGITDPSRSRNISEDVLDDGDRMLIVTSFTSNPLNPQAIPVIVDEEEGTIVFYQEVFSSDGSMRGMLWKLRARKDLDHVRQVLAPIMPDLMMLTEPTEIRERLDQLSSDPESLAAIRSGLLSYFYYYIQENTEDGPDYVLNADRLRDRALNSAERRDFEVLLWATHNHPVWFENPEAVSEALTAVG